MIEEETDDENMINGSKGSPSSCKSESSRRSLDSISIGPLTMALREKLEHEKCVVHVGSFDLQPYDKSTNHSLIELCCCCCC